MRKSNFIKILAKINLRIGLLLRRKNPHPCATEIKTILIKRADRIGDAAVTLPLLLELKKHFDVTVLTSKYNDFLLSKFVKTRIAVVSPHSVKESIAIFMRSVRKGSLAKSEKPKPAFDLFLDLGGIRGLDIFFRIRRQGECKFYAGFNIGIWSRLLDYSEKGYPALFSQRNILESYQALIKGALHKELDMPDYLDLSGFEIKPSDFFLNENFIVVNVSGYENFRGPSVFLYSELFKKLKFNGVIFVIDSPGLPNIKKLRGVEVPENVLFSKRDYSLQELCYIVRRSELYVGADSGITQLLQFQTHSVIFFGCGDHLVWKPYAETLYSRRTINGLIVEETKSSAGKIKKILYYEVPCRPCFDLGCKKRNCTEFFFKDIGLLSREIASLL